VNVRHALIVASLAVVVAVPGSAADPAAPAKTVPQPDTNRDGSCTGKVSGAVQADFACVVTAVKKAGGVVAFEVKVPAPVKGLKTFAPGSFSLKEPVANQTYTHRDLIGATSSAVTTAGKKFSASEKLGDRGDFSVEVEQVQAGRANLATMRIHSHLVPADAKDKSEVQVDVQFLATW
jgi:hypothetical protein